MKKVPGLQVWALDRRSHALERTEVFQQALNGQVSLQQMFDHYLGWLVNGQPADHFQFLKGDDYPFVRDWGMATALEDARTVVLQARGRGKKRRQVVLGGHSLGASLTVAYASWDFNGTPGYKDINGMVLIDGGLMGSFDAFTAAEAQTELGKLENGSPFLDLLGPRGLFLYVLAIATTLAAFVAWRMSRRAPVPATAREGFVNLPATSPALAEIDPRVPGRRPEGGGA